MRKLKLFFLLVIVSAYSKAQVWNELNASDDTTTVLSFYYDSTTNELYLGGQFQIFKGIVANNIIKWNGQQWVAMGNGFNGSGGIKTITKYNGEIVAAGQFDSSGTTHFKMPIAHWNGSQWLPFDTVTEVFNTFGGNQKPGIYSAVPFNNKLYIVGEFYHPEPFPAINYFFSFACWNDTIWQPGTRPYSFMAHSVYPSGQMAAYNNYLYIIATTSDQKDSCTANVYPPANNVTLRGLLRYDPVCDMVEQVGTWIPGNFVHAILPFNGSLYLGLDHYHPQYGSYITRYDGSNFYPVGTGLNGNVEDLSIYQGQLVASGGFTSDTNNIQNLSYVATFDGANWNPIPSACNLDSWSYKIFGLDTLLFASGVFEHCGTTPIGFSAVYPDDLTGINGNGFSNADFSIYPNPAHETISITYHFKVIDNPTFFITDITGRKIKELNLKPTESTAVVSVKYLSKGLYIYSINTTTGKAKTGKLVVE